ncbi:hypothetical protein H5410_044754 [Solanum commersonii]|uniref:Uncharacterized protein n=1 Tax=Solanum commersonii TaxID=4109 RepID=A0A9J5XBS9_SOLCO|nr:hypothetical protein H5410_044754 [Solanum commersonii]
MSEKRQKGLCFFCDEKFVPGHRCSSNKQLYLLEVAEDGEEDQMLEVQEDHDNYEEEEGHEQNCEISVHALNGIHGFNTLRIMGYTKDGPLNILVDPGSSHNFIDDKLIKKLQGDTQLIKPQSVNVADGGNRQTNEWLLPLGEIKLNFQKLTLGFWYQGKEVVIQGTREKTRIVEAKKLDKLAQNGCQLFMIRVLPTDQEQREEPQANASANPILELTKEFQILFQDPKGLPPHRGVFDHKIPLQQGIMTTYKKTTAA